MITASFMLKGEKALRVLGVHVTNSFNLEKGSSYILNRCGKKIKFEFQGEIGLSGYVFEQIDDQILSVEEVWTLYKSFQQGH